MRRHRRAPKKRSDFRPAAAAQVLPSEDPLDATDFDAVAYLNATFPNERSLPRLDPFIVRARARIAPWAYGLQDDDAPALQQKRAGVQTPQKRAPQPHWDE